MQRMRYVLTRAALSLGLLGFAGSWQLARADLIRANPGRTFPDIAGDIVGSQTYKYDPATQTGTFALVNAPHLITLGPSVKDLIPMEPDRDGTLSQSLKLKLDRSGRLVPSPLNRFEIRGTVVINDRTYEGLLLEGRPTAFGVGGQNDATARKPDVFDLNVEITGGQLAGTFGAEAHLRITAQAKSTFNGEFTSDFSGEKPLTNLLALDRSLPAAALEATAPLLAMASGAGLLAWVIRRTFGRSGKRRLILPHQPAGPWASTTC